jgi:chaperonin cofactor prefoldin
MQESQMPADGQENDNQQYALVAEIRAYAQTEFRRLREEVNRIFEIIDDIRAKDSAAAERLSNLRATVDAILTRLQKIEQEAANELDPAKLDLLITNAIGAAFQKHEIEELRNKLEHVDSSPEQVIKRLERELKDLTTKHDTLNTSHDTLKKSHLKLASTVGGLKLKFTLLVGGLALLGGKLFEMISSYVSNLISK